MVMQVLQAVLVNLLIPDVVLFGEVQEELVVVEMEQVQVEVKQQVEQILVVEVEAVRILIIQQFQEQLVAQVK